MPYNSINYYKINFEKEIVFQGNDTAFLTIKRGDETTGFPTPNTPLVPGEKVWVYLWVQPQTLNLDNTLENRDLRLPFTDEDQIKIVNVVDTLPGTYPPQNSTFLTTGGFGSGMTVDVFINDSGQLVSIKVNNPGSGYVNGDILSLSGYPSISFELSYGDLLKYDTDDNFYINGIKLSDFTTKKQFGAAGFATQGTNITDGITWKNYTKNVPSQRWHKLEKPDDEIVFRVDYDGIKDAHMKVVFLFYRAPAVTALPTYLNLAAISSPPGILPDYGVKRNHDPFSGSLYPPQYPTGPYDKLENIDYQEVHIFGYKESYVRPSREIYQNLYPSVGDSINDDKSSYGLLRTNPKLSGNIKLTVDSVGSIWLNTIDANDQLSNSKYKRYPLSPKSSYVKDVSDFAGSIPPEVLFSLYQVDTQYLNTKRKLHEQYDNFYTYGVEQLNNKYYDENFSFFAPIWLRKRIPDYFVIMRLDHPLEEESYDETISQEERLKKFFEKGNIVKTFDLGETSKIGAYLRKLINDTRFIDRPLEASYEKDSPTTWHGIDYRQGSLTGKGEFLYDFFTKDNPIQDFEEYLTLGFQRNGILSANLINLEFLFNDEEAKLYSINRYVGLYVDENQLADIEISGFALQKNLEQTPAPKPGVDGEPYSNRDFIQSNENGIVIPVHYYQGDNIQIGAEPEFTGTVNGKLPRIESVLDPLRIFYIKDREGNFKRIRDIKEVEYGFAGTPNSIKVSELRLGDKQENIALYGGVNEIVSQFDANLLDGSKSQLVVNFYNTAKDTQILQNEEEIKIVQRKLNQAPRNFDYTITVTNAPILQTGLTLEFSESGSTLQVRTFTYPFVGPGVCDIDAFLRLEFDPSYSYAVGMSWNVQIINNEIYIYGSNPIVAKQVPQYEEFTWRMIANPIGLPTGGAFRYPTYDPDGYNNLSHFNPEGKPADVAKSLAECINSFENRIVDALAVGEQVILRSRVPYEDGNSIALLRTLQKNSVFNNLTFYQNDLVKKDIVVPKELIFPVSQELNETVIKFYEQIRYFDEYVYFYMTSSTLMVRIDVDPLNPSTTGILLTYPTSNDTVDVYREGVLLFTFNIKNLKTLFRQTIPENVVFPSYLSCTFRIQSRDREVEQYFIGGVRRNRSRARLALKDSQRYYFNNADISLLRANPSKITQQWFQTQKDKYSLLKGWEVQGQYIYSLPYYDEPIYDSRGNVSGYNKSLTHDIIQVENGNEEFFQTRDKRIVAYKVYRPSVGVFSIYPLKVFDTDVFFSDYSYTQTPEVFRYYQKEPLIPKDVYRDIITGGALATALDNVYPQALTYNYQKELPLFENWRLRINKDFYEVLPSSYDMEILLEGYDGNSNTWIELETVILNRFDVPDDNGDVFIFNTYFPIYIYNQAEIPNDDPQNTNTGPQYTMVGKRNYNKKTYDLTRNVFTKARISFVGVVNNTSGNPSPCVIEIDNNCYADDPDISTFNGFVGLQDFVTAQDEEYIQKLRAENNPERFTYQLLLSEYDRLRENFTKEWAVKSKVVPYVQKWVQEGTDARDNYYRLNNSSAFGLTNFSPDPEVTFTEPLLLTHEFPYLDRFPKDYPDESVENSRLYFFNKLDDRVFDYELNILLDTNNALKSGVSILTQDYKNDGFEKNYFYIEIIAKQDTIDINRWSYNLKVWKYVDLNDYKNTGVYAGEFLIDDRNNYVFEDLEYKLDFSNVKKSTNILFSVQSSDPKTWYDVLKTDKTDDWFTKYFSVGCPTELLPINIRVPKNREERYTFFNYNDGLGRSQTLFHGAKVQILDVNSDTLVEVADSNKFEDYKFSAIARVVRKTNLVTQRDFTYDENGDISGIEKDVPPFRIEIVKNDIYKSVLMIMTINQNDYRLQSGGADYTFFYAAVNEMKSHMQAQGETQYAALNYNSDPSKSAYYVNSFQNAGYLPDYYVGGAKVINIPLILPNGTGYSSDVNVPVTGGTGSGMTVNIVTSGGGIILAFVQNPGRGYSVGDTVTVDQTGASLGTIQIQEIYDGLQFFAVEPYINKPLIGLGSDIRNDYWYQTARQRVGFMGGGYLQIGDPKIRSILRGIDPISSSPLFDLRINTADIKTGYDIPLYDDLFQLSEVLPFYRRPLGGSPLRLFGNRFIFGIPSTIGKKDFDSGYLKYGFYNRIYGSAYQAGPIPSGANKLTYFSIVPNPVLTENANVSFNSITFNQAYNNLQRPIYFWRSAVAPASGGQVDGTKGTVPSSFGNFPESLGYTGFSPIPGETFHLYGGAQIIDSKKTEYSFANIFKLINEDNNIQVTYYEITKDAVGETKNYKLRFVSSDKIVKTSKFYFADDTDKPAEYADVANIGRDFIPTNEPELVLRHRGYYEPKANEVISFWVREDELFTSHFKKDYVLKNTRINNLTELSGVIRNLSYNKVADSEVLKISRGSSYKSLYPYVGEVAIDKGNQFVILSTWDDKLYRKYDSTTTFSLVPGIEDMKEYKSFLGSKVMNVPVSFEMQEFLPDEVTYEVIEPGTAIGVAQLGRRGRAGDATRQIEQDGNKPKLVITLNLEKRLLRQLKEDLLNPENEDEFLRLLNLSPVELNSLVPAQIETLKNEYFTQNIIPLYQVNELNLWLNTNEGFPIVDINLPEVTKISLGYEIDKNCSSQQNKNLQYTITKILDTKQAQGFSVSVLLKRI